MRLLIRLFWVIFASFFKPKMVLPTDKSILKLHVMPTDLDILGHLNNGRTLTIMDLGRIDIIMRTGFWKAALKHKLCPLVGTVMIRFKRSLNVFQSFELHSRILCWDDKWFYMEHHIMRKGSLVAFAWMKGLFVGKGGRIIPSSEIVELSDHKGMVSPPVPHDLAHWIKSTA